MTLNTNNAFMIKALKATLTLQLGAAQWKRFDQDYMLY